MKNKKALKQNVITYGMVIAFWAVIQIMMKTGNLSSLAKGLLVPICMYVILAVSLNLTVGILGELSLGHAGFMCVGAFSGAFFTKVAESAIPSVGVRFFIMWFPDRYSGTSSERRLSGDRNPGIWRDHQEPDQRHVCRC